MSASVHRPIPPHPLSGAAWAGRRIGLLGGSFNPAHDGHRHISLFALKALGLDQVWWLVSPHNPLKPVAGMAPLSDRLAGAQAWADHPRIVISDLERRLGTRYTADTLACLARRFPRTRFVWLIGADNLSQLPRWRRWPEIFLRVAIAAFNRPPYSIKALASRAAQRFRRNRLPEARARRLAKAPLPAWSYLGTPAHPASATAIRGRRLSGNTNATATSQPREPISTP
ncbi:putative nicotinate-nucleotide adenylyltransferase [Azospirillaceae bacterium]